MKNINFQIKSDNYYETHYRILYVHCLLECHSCIFLCLKIHFKRTHTDTHIHITTTFCIQTHTYTHTTTNFCIQTHTTTTFVNKRTHTATSTFCILPVQPHRHTHTHTQPPPTQTHTQKHKHTK